MCGPAPAPGLTAGRFVIAWTGWNVVFWGGAATQMVGVSSSLFVFATATGRPLYCRNVSERGIGKAADRAGLNPAGVPRLTMHDLRHTFASHLIRSGADVYTVSRQLGHARASRSTCTRASSTWPQNAEALRERLSLAFGD